jgi:hypothetical protein
MDTTPYVQDISFDPETTQAMGQAFDQACKSLRNFGLEATVREIIAKRIVEAAENGERDPVRLHEQALKSLGIEETSNLLVA